MHERNLPVAFLYGIFNQLPDSVFIIRQHCRNPFEHMIHCYARNPASDQRLHFRGFKFRADKTHAGKIIAHAGIRIFLVFSSADEGDRIASRFCLFMECVKNQYKKRMRQAFATFFFINDAEPARFCSIAGICRSFQNPADPFNSDILNAGTEYTLYQRRIFSASQDHIFHFRCHLISSLKQINTDINDVLNCFLKTAYRTILPYAAAAEKKPAGNSRAKAGFRNSSPKPVQRQTLRSAN